VLKTQPSEVEYHLPPDRFNEDVRTKLRGAMQDVLKNAGFTSGERKDIASKYKIRELNRRSFQSVVERMLEVLDLHVSEGELKLFIRSRNSLVHRGQFYCHSADVEDRADYPPKERPYEEYEFLIEVLDRLFLRLLGFEGAYVDWRGRELSVRSRSAASMACAEGQKNEGTLAAEENNS
jgi:hypothetical protein